jgi:hypothetical protein
MGQALGKWGSAAALFFAINALLLVLSLYQATAEGTAKHALRRAITALVEIDSLIARDYESLQERARSAAPGEELRLRDFPLEVSLTSEEVLDSTPADLRAILLDRSDDQLYDHGTAALRSDGASEPSRFSAAGLLDRWLDLLRGRNHDVTAVLTGVAAVVCLALVLILMSTSRGFGRIAAVGAVTLAGAVPTVAVALLLRLNIRLASDGDTEYTQRELLEIGDALVWIPLRNGIAFAALGAALLLAGWAFAILTDRRQAPRYSAGPL